MTTWPWPDARPVCFARKQMRGKCCHSLGNCRRLIGARGNTTELPKETMVSKQREDFMFTLTETFDALTATALGKVVSGFGGEEIWGLRCFASDVIDWPPQLGPSMVSELPASVAPLSIGKSFGGWAAARLSHALTVQLSVVLSVSTRPRIWQTWISQSLRLSLTLAEWNWCRWGFFAL